MIDQAALEARYPAPDETYNAVVKSLQFLHRVGFFDFLVQTNVSRIAGGFDDQNIEELAAAIHEVRQTNRALLTLDSLAQELQERKIS